MNIYLQQVQTPLTASLSTHINKRKSEDGTITYIFRNCIVTHNPKFKFTQTIFNDGKSVPAVPHDTDEYRRKAVELGYGEDTAKMSFEHEIAHTFIMEKLGYDYSPTLKAVSQGYDDIAAYQEEDVILDFQKALNNSDISNPLSIYIEEFKDLFRNG